MLLKSVICLLQLVRSNTRRFMPSQADEEAHQLSYLQKHMANILALLAEPVEGEGEESLVCFVKIAHYVPCAPYSVLLNDSYSVSVLEVHVPLAYLANSSSMSRCDSLFKLFILRLDLLMIILL